MGKISLVSAKYIIQARIDIDGIVDKPDVIGAIFGQTEGLLGSELELRELQRSGRIGRIEVELTQKQGKTSGSITIPSSLDMAEISIVGAAMEVIQRIGPCTAKIAVQKIEDVRVSKRRFVIDRAKELLKNLIDGYMPDSQELAEEVAHSVRMFEIKSFGKDKLPAGPAIDESDEVIVVEGRADVLNLLKYGIKNSIAMNGSSVPKTIIELSKQKIITVFVDGDRGGDLNIRELISVCEIDFVTKAPDGKEVEELTKKEIIKALRSKVTVEQIKNDLERNVDSDNRRNNSNQRSDNRRNTNSRNDNRRNQRSDQGKNNRSDTRRNSNTRSNNNSNNVPALTKEAKANLKKLLDDVVGSKGAFLLNNGMKLLGKVPLTELIPTVDSLDDVATVVIDGVLDDKILKRLENTSVNRVACVNSKSNSNRIKIFTMTNLS